MKKNILFLLLCVVFFQGTSVFPMKRNSASGKRRQQQDGRNKLINIGVVEIDLDKCDVRSGWWTEKESKSVVLEKLGINTKCFKALIKQANKEYRKEQQEYEQAEKNYELVEKACKQAEEACKKARDNDYEKQKKGYDALVSTLGICRKKLSSLTKLLQVALRSCYTQISLEDGTTASFKAKRTKATAASIKKNMKRGTFLARYGQPIAKRTKTKVQKSSLTHHICTIKKYAL